MRRNNLWNRIFHKSEIQETKQKILQAQLYIQNAPKVLNNIRESHTFSDLLWAHAQARSSGFTNLFPGDNVLSYFHTKIGYEFCGIEEKSISQWDHDESLIGENICGFDPKTSKREIVMKYYHDLLYSKISEIELGAHKLIREASVLGY